MRTCTSCGVARPISEFNKQASARDGLKRRCKACQSSENRARYERAGDHIRATVKAYAATNADKVSASKRESYVRNKAVRLASQKEYTRVNRDRIYARNREYIKARPEKEREYGRRYRQANLHMGRARASRRLAQKLKATPSWANAQKIRAFYESADALGMLTGEWHHVDHIVPLQGKTVCGLHNEFNLQILTAFDNVSKGNRHWPDQP